MVRDIFLHGWLGQKYEPHHRLDVATAREAVHALCVLNPGFAEDLRQGSYRVTRGDFDLDVDALALGLGNAPLHIAPVVVGAGGNGGGVKIIIGVALIAAAFFTGGASLGALGALSAEATIAGVGLGFTYANIAMFGAMLALSGISQMLSPTPKTTDLSTPAEQRPSFVFNGAVNVSAQGGCVAVWYGRVRVGSTVVSAGLRTEQI